MPVPLQEGHQLGQQLVVLVARDLRVAFVQEVHQAPGVGEALAAGHFAGSSPS